MKKFGYVLFLALFFISLAGCGGVFAIASPNQTAADQGSLVLSKRISPATRFVDGAIAVGKELGYQVSSVDRKTNIVSFNSQTNLGLVALVGKNVITTVQLALQSGGRTIDITVTIMGNFGEAEQSAAAKIIADFKASLTKQFAS